MAIVQIIRPAEEHPLPWRCAYVLQRRRKIEPFYLLTSEAARITVTLAALSIKEKPTFDCAARKAPQVTAGR